MRCRPLGRLDQTDPAITLLLAQLEVQPMRRWSEADLVQMGLDPSTVRRGFKTPFWRNIFATCAPKAGADGAARSKHRRQGD